jgi:hypothetical protein
MLLRVKVNPLAVSLSEDSPGHNSLLANARLLHSSLCTYNSVLLDNNVAGSEDITSILFGSGLYRRIPSRATFTNGPGWIS